MGFNSKHANSKVRLASFRTNSEGLFKMVCHIQYKDANAIYTGAIQIAAWKEAKKF